MNSLWLDIVNHHLLGVRFGFISLLWLHLIFYTFFIHFCSANAIIWIAIFSLKAKGSGSGPVCLPLQCLSHAYILPLIQLVLHKTWQFRWMLQIIRHASTCLPSLHPSQNHVLAPRLSAVWQASREATFGYTWSHIHQNPGLIWFSLAKNVDLHKVSVITADPRWIRSQIMTHTRPAWLLHNLHYTSPHCSFSWTPAGDLWSHSSLSIHPCSTKHSNQLLLMANSSKKKRGFDIPSLYDLPISNPLLSSLLHLFGLMFFSFAIASGTSCSPVNLDRPRLQDTTETQLRLLVPQTLKVLHCAPTRTFRAM